MEQKKYDIFVSYSRKDMDVVEKLVGNIHTKTNARCWVDWNGIESGEQFVDVIINAIDRVDTVLFILSDNSMASEFARREIDYARNTGKKIVPVVVDGGKLRGWFLFFFGSVDYIDVQVPVQYEKLLRNLGEWYGGKPTIDETLPNVEVETNPKQSFHSKESSKTYKIGDFYNENGKQGIVFDVTVDGKHGKIVSLDENELKWAVDGVCFRNTDATSNDNGMSNLDKIKILPNWKTYYPAFAWCAAKGNGWYLPAKDELHLVFENKNVLNRILKERGYAEINADYSLWSSTENEESDFCAWRVGMGYTFNYPKDFNHGVRAVATF